MYYLNCFFVYSIMGFFLETLYAFLTRSDFKSGILKGPWTPIYGFGTVAILLLSNYFFMNLHMPRWLETLIVFIIVGIFLSCLELIGGIAIENFAGISFWDYSDQKYHIGKYISLEMTFIWGFLSIIFIYILNPMLKKIISAIPFYITILLSILMIADFSFTLYRTIKK